MAKNQSGTRAQKPNRTILSRTLLLLVVCGIVAFIVLGARLFHLQIIQHEELEKMAVEQQTRETTVSASRGSITDRNGNIMAMSATAETVYISPHEMELYDEDVNLIASKLSEILGVSAESVIEKSKDTDSWYKTIAKKVELDVSQQVREFKSEYGLKSVHIESDTKRYYPYGSLACHIVGFVGDDNYGLDGTEKMYDEYLEGVDGSVVRLKTASGSDMLYTKFENYYDAIDGCDVELTIDVTAQYYAEKYLGQAIEDNDARNGGCCIIMDVNSGAILGMASYGNYDLNDYLAVSEKEQAKINALATDEEKAEALYQAQLEQWRNMAISDTYEPGSVFKTITLAMALEEGAVTKSESFYCGGSVEVLGRTVPVNCWKDEGHGSQTLTQAAQHSCNVAFVNIGKKIGAEKFYDYVEAFGFFEKTGIDLLGEAGTRNLWWSEEVFCDKNNLSQLAAASFGQTFNITPIQMVTAMSAIANGGELMEPYVVSKVTNADGDVVYSKEPTTVRRVISEETSRTVCSILEEVVGGEGGTGSNAYVSGYRVGGKTGTTTKTTVEVETGVKEYMVSFCGIAPADDPQVAVLVILDNPSNETGIYISGGVMAAPVVGNIMSELLPYLGIEPIYSDNELKYIDVTMPRLESSSVEDAKKQLAALGLGVRVVGDGDTVTDQLPAAKARIATGTEVVLYAGDTKPDKKVIVPDIRKMTAATARQTLAERGLYLNTAGALPTSGNVVVSKQAIDPGSEVAYGSVIRVTLVDQSKLGRY